MATASLRSRMSAAIRALGAPQEKQGSGIWGGDWTQFMGISAQGGDGVQDIGDQPSDHARARTAESYIYRCEEVRGRSISQVPLRVWELDAEGNRQRAVEHDALGVLAVTNPYGYVDGIPRLMRYTLGSLDLHGRSAWKLAFDRRKRPSEVYWQIPTAFEPVPDPARFFKGIRVHAEGVGVQEIPAEELVYLATDNPQDPLRGTSKITVLKNAINLRQYSARSNIDFFKDSMRPDWILSGNWSNTQDNIDRLRRAIRRWLSGEHNRAPLVLGEGATAHLLTTSHKDAEWIQQQRLSQEEISAAFGVPLIFLNNYDRATYENIRTAKLLLWHDTMIPESDVMAEDLTRLFLWRYWPETRQRRLAFGFDYNRIEGLGEDLALIWERMTKLMQQITAQVEKRELTPNQARRLYVQMVGELGLDVEPWQGDIEGGDTFFLPYQNLPLDQLSVQAIINIMASRGTNPQLEENVPGAPRAGDNAEAPNPDKPPATGLPANPEDEADLDRRQRELDEREQRLSEREAEARQTGDGQGGKAAREGLEGLVDLEEFRRSLEQVARGAVGAALKQERESAAPARGPNPLAVRDARLAPVQARLVKRLKRHFQDLQTQALRTLRGGKGMRKDAEEETLPDPSQDLWDSPAAVAALVELVREGVAASAEQAYAAAAEDYGLQVSWNVGNPWLEQHMGYRLPLIKGIDDNLRERLRQSLLEGAEAGEGVPDLARRVRAEFEDCIDYRSELIARTEVVNAYGLASLAAYRDAGLEQAQMYDGPNRDGANCADVNGQVVSLEEARRLMALEHPNGTRGVAPYTSGGWTAAAAQPGEAKGDEAEAGLVLEGASAGVELYVKAS